METNEVLRFIAWAAVVASGTLVALTAGLAIRFRSEIKRAEKRIAGLPDMVTMNSVEVHEVEGSEGREAFNSLCEYYLDMSGDAFLEKWKAGTITYADGEADSRISRVISALPFANG